jgi:DNA-binding CsgD family transcriptional regulator
MLAAAERAQEVRAALTVVPDDPDEARRVAARQLEGRAVEALSYRMAGLSYDQIAERMGEEPHTVQALVERSVTRARNAVAEPMRDLENARLDRVQAAIWPEALKGDIQAVNAFLAISQRRARIEGLDDRDDPDDRDD